MLPTLKTDLVLKIYEAMTKEKETEKHWIEFNANDYARIKPNEHTLKAFLDHWGPHIGYDRAKRYYESKIDKDGCYVDQLWCIMAYFGSAFNGSILGPFESKIQLENRRGNQTIGTMKISELINKETSAERDRLKEELEKVSESLKQMIDLNVANEAFDSGEDWRKEHKVTDGESFPHWYMRYYSEEMRLLKEQIRLLELEELNWKDTVEIVTNERDSLKQLNSELVDALESLVKWCKLIDGEFNNPEIESLISKANQQKENP